MLVPKKPDNFEAVMIKSALPNYPAAEAGLREGDEIIYALWT